MVLNNWLEFMYRSFIYSEDKDHWLEENHLLYHDLCAILDETEKVVYLWNGPKSTSERLNKGKKMIKDLISNYLKDTFQLIILDKKIPPRIQKKLNEMQEEIRKEEQEERGTFSSVWSIRLYFTFSCIAIFLSLISLLNLTLAPSSWSKSNGNIIISNSGFDIWITISVVLTSISLALSFLNIILGIWEQEGQVIVCSLIGIILFIGLLLYLSQGIHLFEFQPGFSSTKYIISQKELNIFRIIVLLLLLFLIPNTYKLIVFLKKYKKFIF